MILSHSKTIKKFYIYIPTIHLLYCMVFYRRDTTILLAAPYDCVYSTGGVFLTFAVPRETEFDVILGAWCEPFALMESMDKGSYKRF